MENKERVEVMIQDDTVKLLRECNSGIKMGVSSIEEVLPAVENKNLKQVLNTCKKQHEELGNETHALLNSFHDEGKEPGMIAKGMAKMTTESKLFLHQTDNAIADLMIDGCNMGVKTLSRHLNQFQAADERSKDIARRLVTLEDDLAVDLRPFL